MKKLVSAAKSIFGIALIYVATASGVGAQSPNPDVVAAQQDGKAFGQGAKASNADIAEQEVTSDNVPGYQPAPPELSSLYGNDDAALNGAAGSAVGGEPWQVMLQGDGNMQRIDRSGLTDLLEMERSIAEAASPSDVGGGLSSTPGTCEEVTVSQTQPTYEATCDVGVTVGEVDEVPSYSCPAGWDLDGTNCRRTETQAAQVTYSCPSGLALNGTNCEASQPATISSYSCPTGFSLSGTTCTQTLTQNANLSSYSCPADYVLNGNLCERTLTQSATPNYSCPAGYDLADTSCSQTTTSPAIPSYSCPADWTLNGTTCSRELVQPATPNYSCSNGGVLTGTSCVTNGSYAATPTYYCPAGYSLSGTSCSSTATQPAAPTYYCPSGFSLQGTSCVQSSSYAATPSYSCPSGYSLNGTVCEQTSSYAAVPVYSCPTGYTLSGTSCTQVASQPATPNYQCGSPSPGLDKTVINGQTVCGTPRNYFSGNKCPTTVTQWFLFQQNWPGTNTSYCFFKPNTTYTCPGDQWQNYNQMCTTTLTQTASISGYSCPNGGTLSGTTCVTMSTTQANVSYSCQSGGALQGTLCQSSNTVGATVSYSCPTGYDLSGSTCSQTLSQSANVSYSCPSGGTLSGSTCSTSSNSAATVSYSCPAGYGLNGTSCSQIQTQGASVSYSCPAGMVQSGTTCSYTVNMTANVSYSCPTGYSLSGTSCVQVQSVAATPVYTCPPNYSLSGTTCSSTQAQPANPNYSCPQGYTLSGTTCSTSIAATVNYSCPSGFDLNQSSCSRVLTQPALVTMVCPDGSTAQDGTCYGESPGTSECADLESNSQCTWLRDTCLDEQASASCKVTERTYRCPVPGEPAIENKEYVCSGDIYCINGECQTIEREASSEFKDALVAMGAMDQTEKEFDPDSLGLFKGSRETCHKPVFGLVNCCAGKVSGLLSGGSALLAFEALGSGGVAAIAGIATQFLTTFLCSNEEKKLDVKDRLGLCHFVGSYCSSSFLGVCKTKKKAYCCFESKLTRILQEQGRPQIDKPWDKPKDEKCEGFTVDEFSRLDLSQMDFSEIYAEFLEAAKLPNEAQMASDIQAKIQSYYQQHGQGGI